jgi:hypothetical protein
MNVLVFEFECKPTTDHKRKLILQKGNRSHIINLFVHFHTMFKCSIDFAAITKLKL